MRVDRYYINPCVGTPWWRHQMETFSALLAICAENSPVSGEFPAQRPVTRSFDIFFDVRLIKRLSKHSRGWWFETLSHPLWRHRNAIRNLWLFLLVNHFKYLMNIYLEYSQYLLLQANGTVAFSISGNYIENMLLGSLISAPYVLQGCSNVLDWAKGVT